MALSIKDDETDALVRRLAEIKNVSYTAAVRLAVSNELAKSSSTRKDADRILDRIADLQGRIAALKIQDKRSAEDIVGYDEDGLPS